MNVFSRLRRLVHGPIDMFKAIIQALDNQQKQLNTIIELQRAQLVMTREQLEAIDALTAVQSELLRLGTSANLSAGSPPKDS